VPKLNWTSKFRKSELIGQVIEIDLGGFYAYGVCVYERKKRGHLVRLYEHTSVTQLQALNEITAMKSRISVFIPLRYVISEPEFRIVGKIKLTRADRAHPCLRQAVLSPHGEKAKGWWIIKGSSEKWVTELPAEAAFFPEAGIYNLAAIRHLFEENLYQNSTRLLQKGPLAFEPNGPE